MNNPYLDRISVVKIVAANKGTIKAFASVKLGETLTIHSVKVIQQDGQRAYVRLPDQKSSDGNNWFPIVSADDPRFQDAIQEKVLAAWQNAGAV